jgi:hypothetical protein
MVRSNRLTLAIATLCLFILAGCATTLIRDNQIDLFDNAWVALDPFTNSHEPTNWTVVDQKQMKGNALPEVFLTERSNYCFGSKTPPPEKALEESNNYWYLVLEPIPATESPQITKLSPTQPPDIPEPFVRRGLFLIDENTGVLVAFRLVCVVY